MIDDSLDVTLPDGLELVHRTPTFDEHTAPASLLNCHQVEPGAWALLVVTQGALDLEFEDTPDRPHRLAHGESFVIPPQRPHKVIITEPAHFYVELHRTPQPQPGA